MTYTRQRFAPETICSNCSEVFERFEFGGGEPFTKYRKVIALVMSEMEPRCRHGAYIDPMPVVSDLEQLEPAVFDHNFQRRGSRVDGIFDELFQSMNGCNNNLPRGNFIDNILIKGLDARPSARSWSASVASPSLP